MDLKSIIKQFFDATLALGKGKLPPGGSIQVLCGLVCEGLPSFKANITTSWLKTISSKHTIKVSDP